MKSAVEAKVELMENYVDLDKELDTIEAHFNAMGELPEVRMSVDVQRGSEM